MRSRHIVAIIGVLMLVGASDARPVVIAAVDPWTTWTGATDAPRMLASSSSGRAQLWDTQNHVAVRTFNNVSQVVLSPDARLIAANAPSSANINVITADDGATVARIVRASGGQRALAISPDDALIALDVLGSDAEAIVVASARTGTIAYRLPGTGGGAAFSPDGKTLATLEPRRGDVLLWDARSGRFRQRLTGDAGVFGPPLFSPDGRYLLTVSNPVRTPPHSDGSFQINSIDYPELQLELWDLAAGRVVHRVPFWDDQGSTFDESPGFFAFADARHVVAGSRSGSAVLADIATGVVERINARGFIVRGGPAVEILDKAQWTELSGGALHPILRFAQLLDMTYMAVSAGGLVATAAGERVFVWDLARAELRCSATLEDVNYLSFTAAGDLDVLANGSLRINSLNCKPADSDSALTPEANDGVISPDKSRVLRFAAPLDDRASFAAPSNDRAAAASLLEVRVARNDALLASVPGITSGDPMGPRFALRAPVAALLTNHSPQEIVVVDAATGKTRLRVADNPFALSPDGATLAVASQGQTTFYDTPTGHITGRYDYAESRFSYTPSGARFVALSDGTLRICTLAGETIATLSVFATQDAEPAWTIDLPNGDYVASSAGAAFVNGGRVDAAAVHAVLDTALR